jgi:hypothetical protein
MARPHIPIHVIGPRRKSASERILADEILRRIEKLLEDLGTHGRRCDRCDKVHATIERAVRYHMALWWSMEFGSDEATEEMTFINDLRSALPTGVDVEVRLSEAAKILEEE